jgi:hypothetical protein
MVRHICRNAARRSGILPTRRQFSELATTADAHRDRRSGRRVTGNSDMARQLITVAVEAFVGRDKAGCEGTPKRIALLAGRLDAALILRDLREACEQRLRSRRLLVGECTKSPEGSELFGDGGQSR